MTKIITKTANDKAMEWVKKYDAIKVHETEEGSTIVETYANTGGETGYDFDVLVVRYKNKGFDNATLYTFKDMDIDKHLVPYEPSTYNFYAWIERTQDHVNADDFHRWVGNNEFDSYFFDLYVDYLIDLRLDGCVSYTEEDITPDYKTQTLAESIKQSFADVFDEEIWAKVLTDAFNAENSGQGVWLVRSNSSFYKEGYAYTARTDNHAYIIMVNSNIWDKVISYVKREGFGLWHGSVCVYGSGCAHGERVTIW